MSGATLYDAVEYPSRAFSQTHPERAAAIGTLLGLSPAKPAEARVLEVGCGSGWNLIPMASELPGAKLFGFDLAGSAIEAAVRDTQALGLGNLRFEQLDLMEFSPDLGEFDYIIAHGFYSWVPRQVRLKLLDVCRDHLAPQGLAFISFNAYPFGRLRRMWREMMEYHAERSGAVEPAERLAASEAFLTTLRDQWLGNPKLVNYGHLVAAQVDAIHQGGGNWFFHDDLGPIFEPLSIAEFGSELQTRELQYVSEALYEHMKCDAIPEPLVEAAGNDWIAREQYLDNFIFRGFRMALVCRGSGKLNRPPGDSSLERLWYSGPLVRTGPGVFRNEWTNSEAETADIHTLAALNRLARAWPDNMSFAELDLPPSSLMDLIAANIIEPSVTPRKLPKASANPIVWPTARLQAARGKVVTNRLHGAIQLEQEELRQFVTQLDGSRPVAGLAHLVGGKKEMLRQVEWLHRAALIQ